tara:strand:- start:69 stop:191 length:123 start_codon:yes stop_codon:yes gene_type:complete
LYEIAVITAIFNFEPTTIKFSENEYLQKKCIKGGSQTRVG